MNLLNVLDNNANRMGDHVAITEIVDPFSKENQKTVTWREFVNLSNKLANWLISIGILKNQKVAILLNNCIEWLPVFFGIQKAEAIPVLLNYNYDADKIKYCMDLTECSTIIFSSEFSEKIGIAMDGCAEDIYIYHKNRVLKLSNVLRMFSSTLTMKTAVADEDYAAIYFSSGTTGFPKAILHTHRALFSAAITEQKHHEQKENDIFLIMPPLYHAGVKIHWFGSLLTGGGAVILKSPTPKNILETISNEQITIVFMLLPWAQDMLDAIENQSVYIDDYDLSSWRLTHMGAQPIPSSLIQRWLYQFPMQSYDTNYGLTEAAGPGCVHLGKDNIHKAGSIGKAGHGWRVSIRDEKGSPVDQGEVGELVVHGMSIMKMYYNDLLATESAIKNGWLYTGDMAYEDADGFLYIVDRKKDMIISGGENIYAVQIEDYLRKHPAIKDVAAIGVADYRLGEVVAVIVEIKSDMQCTKREIREFCKGLSQYERPRRIFLDKVPRNSTGKIDKVYLRLKYQ